MLICDILSARRVILYGANREAAAEDAPLVFDEETTNVQAYKHVQMAQILGVQQSRINRFETGQSTPSPDVFLKYADYFDVSMDYLYCRTDEPRGKLYDYQPERLKGKNIQNQELRDFIEMCFDPQAPVNKRLKEALFRIMEEGQEKT